MPLFALTIYWQYGLSIKGRTNHGHTSTEVQLYSSLLKEKMLSKDHN